MTSYRLKNVLLVAVALLSALVGLTASAQTSTLDTILEVSAQKTQAARESQVKVDRLADETRNLLDDYKTVMKQIDGLRVYNARLQRQIDNQLRRIADIDDSIDQVTVIQRQMTPLVIRMIDGLEQFVEMDVPFNLEERRQRIEFLKTNVDRADLTVAEKFRQVLEAYNIELQYGRGFETYTDTIDLGTGARDVDFLRIGRIALVYQTSDGAEAGAWNNQTRSWEPLPTGDYASAIRKGVRIAKKTATIELLNMPIAAPEAQ
ncbi:MAG: DUF3450 domain-containing protein [Congregibacter sp.]|nr:DUF3450 domain-containing protein [Congregibacter sp.]